MHRPGNGAIASIDVAGRENGMYDLEPVMNYIALAQPCRTLVYKAWGKRDIVHNRL
jgi:hypothetical protein